MKRQKSPFLIESPSLTSINSNKIEASESCLTIDTAIQARRYPQIVWRSPVEVVSKVHGDQHTGWRWVDAHVVGGVVEELGSGVAFDVVGVVVTPPELDVDPILLCGGTVHCVPDR